MNIKKHAGYWGIGPAVDKFNEPGRRKGRLFAFEGLDGCGKTLLVDLVRSGLMVQASKLEAEQKKQQINTVVPEIKVVRQPGGTLLGEKLRLILKDPAFALTPLVQRMLFEADNLQFIEEIALPMAERGGILICDRWGFLSTFCYGIPRGIPSRILQHIQALTPAVKLDILFLVRTPFHCCMERLQYDSNRKRKPCAIEQLGTDYLRHVNRHYEEAAQNKAPKRKTGGQDWSIWEHTRSLAEQVVVLDGSKKPTELGAAALAAITRLKPFLQ